MSPDNQREILTKAGKIPYSPSLAYGSLVFISGSIGRSPETGEISDDITEQTNQVMAKIQHLLEQAGSSFDKALRVTIFLVDMAEYSQVNEAYRQFFDGDFPARSCVQVGALPDPKARVEIDVIAGR